MPATRNVSPLPGITVSPPSKSKENVAKILLGAMAQEVSIKTKKEPFPCDEIVSTPIGKKSTRKIAVVTPSKLSLDSPVSKSKKEIKEQEKSITTPLISSARNLSSSFSSKTFNKSTLAVDPRVEIIYKVIHKATGSLGGNGTTGAIYGEITLRSMQRVVNILINKCGMDHSSRFIDVGAGLGKPNFHVAQDPAVRLSIGVELEDIRWQVNF